MSRPTPFGFEHTTSKQVDSASRALSSLITKLIKNGGLPFTVYSKLFESCICSISQYGSEIFGFQQYDSTFKLHLRAARAYLGLPKNVTSYGLISEVGWLLPQFRSHIRMIQQFGRILNTASNGLLFKLYKWDYYLNNAGVCKTWSSEIKNILENHNLGHVFDAQSIFPGKSTVYGLAFYPFIWRLPGM